MRQIRVEEAQVGDVIAEPIEDQNGRVLLPAGAKLSQAVLARLEGWGVFALHIEGEEQQVLVGILVSTEHLTVGRIDLLPARRSSTHEHQGDESIYVLAGSLHIYLPDHSGQRWFQLKPGDGFYLPEGTPHQYHNITDKPAEMVFAVSPNYKSRQ